MQNKSEALTNLGAGALLAVLAVVFWDKVQGIAVFILTLGVLVGIHEWGHFIAAKSVGVHVYEFALGFGPKLVTYMRRNGTEYTIRAIPLGGFVNPKGMQPDDPITADGINGRRPAERALVYLAGPLMNAILCVVVFCSTGWLLGGPDLNVVLVGEVTRKSPAESLQPLTVNAQPALGFPKGLRVGDRILEVNGKPIKDAVTVTGEIHPNAGKPVTLKVRRGKDEIVFTGTPRPGPLSDTKFLTVQAVPPGTQLPVRPGDQLDKIDGASVYGTVADPASDPVARAGQLLREKAGKPVTLVVWRDGDTRMELNGVAAPIDLAFIPGKRTVGMFGFVQAPGQGRRMSIGESVRAGLLDVAAMFLGYQRLFSQPKDLGKNLSGPIGIGSTLSKSTSLPLMHYAQMLGSLSFSLAFFNLLPVPILDGGHMLLLAIEVIRRRRLDAAAQRTAALVGLVFVGTLAIIISCKDIIKSFL
jgi:regulator of sigma E protease